MSQPNPQAEQVEYEIELIKEVLEKVREELYANSPHILGSDDDNMYRGAIDAVLDQPIYEFLINHKI